MLKITEPEFVLMRSYIEEYCGIHLEAGKEYLIESRLSDLVLENGCGSFQEFHLRARNDSSGKLKERIIDAMTTNETLWFRDANTWKYITEKAVPEILGIAKTKGRARIWSAAASTGQEAYSLLMLLDEKARQLGDPSLVDKVEIIGTDISKSALFLAMAARYDNIAMGRGMQSDKKDRYFNKDGNVWVFDQGLKKKVRFKIFNLQNSFVSMGVFDLVLLRYVAIYFSEEFKRELYRKMAGAVRPGGALVLGATETLRDFTTDFEITYYKNAVVNVRK